MVKQLTILGSTGSIGCSALEVVRSYPGRFHVVALAAHSNVDLLSEQIVEFQPEYVAVGDEDAGRRLRERHPGCNIHLGLEGLDEIAATPVDVTLCAVVGAAGLRPILSAIEAGNTVAIANKEPLVMAGALIMERAASRGVQVLPVDSEHNAIFQCLQGHKVDDVQCIHLTASGGPFYRKPRQELEHVSPEQAVRHPTWDMGPKISIDSSTLMNKGLEVIEAMWLFGLRFDQIEVVIHPQSIVHSLVEFTDGSILAHLGLTDMKFPIQFALTWPDRVERPMGRLNLTEMRELTFAAPDFGEFPCLGYALEAAKTGGTAGAVLNAANEAAVAAFCSHRIRFLEINAIVGEVMASSLIVPDTSLEAAVASDTEARIKAEGLIRQRNAVSPS